MDIVHEDMCTFAISRRIILKYWIFRVKMYRKSKHLWRSVYFFKSCRLSGNVEKYGIERPQMAIYTIQRVRFACWITKATDTHTQYATRTAFPRQQWLRERASMLRYTYPQESPWLTLEGIVRYLIWKSTSLITGGFLSLGASSWGGKYGNIGEQVNRMSIPTPRT